MSEFFESLIKRTSLFIIIIGGLLLLLGVASEFTVSTTVIKIANDFGKVTVSIIGILMIFFGLFLEWKQNVNSKSQTMSKNQAVSLTSAIISRDDGLQDAIDYLSNHPDVKSLVVWGFSLNWLSRVSAFLEDFPHKNLEVKIFVPTEEVIGGLFSVLDTNEHKSVLKLRLSEWSQLGKNGFVKNVFIHYHALVPNDMGLIMDNKYALIGTYDWETKDKLLWHKRRPQATRKFIRILSRGGANDFLLEIYGYRFLCREFDSKQSS